MTKGCGQEIDFITGGNIIMRTEKCGDLNKDGILILCFECQKGTGGKDE